MSCTCGENTCLSCENEKLKLYIQTLLDVIKKKDGMIKEKEDEIKAIINITVRNRYT